MDGESTLFWTDNWWEGKPLCTSCLVLFDLCSDKTEFQEQLAAGIEVLLSAAYQVLTNQGWGSPRILQIEDTSLDEEEAAQDT